MACWSCERPEGDGPLCEKCDAVQPPRPRTHFELLGLPAAFGLDPAAIEARYKEWSRKLHPDRFARAEPRARRYSLEQATALNDAYRTLRDPTRRAEYLLHLQGIQIDSDKGGGSTVKLSASLLGEMMELGEALADARIEGRAADVARMADDVRGRRDRAMSEVEREFRESGDGALGRIATRLAAMRYYDRFLADAAAREPEVQS
jgi:molecular chaperone HscB